MTSFFEHFDSPHGLGVDRVPLSWTASVIHGVAEGVFTPAQGRDALNSRLANDNKAALTAEAEAELLEVLNNIDTETDVAEMVRLFHRWIEAGTAVEQGFKSTTPALTLATWRTWANVSDQSGA